MRHLATLMLLVSFALLTACGGSGPDSDDAVEAGGAGVSVEASGLQASLNDWILGTDFGVERGTIDVGAKTVTLEFAAEGYEGLTDQDKADIGTAMADLVSGGSGASLASLGYRLSFEVAGQEVPVEDGGDDAATSAAQGGIPGGALVDLVFIHHSVGENWLNDGLCQALNDRGYHVADIYYGWREYGDRTDTTDWPMWFTDEVMGLVYAEMDNMTAPNTLQPASGENTIVMFKSCFPNSDVGSDIADERAVYRSLLPYLGRHPDKMFVLITPPPMQQISNPQKTRELCDWLSDRRSGWLAGYAAGNVFVFDLYNVLTDPGAHHRLEGGKEVHQSVSGHDTLYYDSDGDDHPNTAGNVKAAEEFVPLLDEWYGQFKESRG